MSTKRNVTVANAASNGAAIAPTVTLGSRGPEGPTSNTNNSNNTSIARQQKQRDRDEREGIVLWRRPITTIEYFTKEMLVLLNTYGQKLLYYKITVLLLISAVLLSVFILNIGGPHQLMVQQIYKKLLWCSYWIGLGILSSVGLGTGLHTFLLYLGPHIAQVTLASYECGSLDFPEPPYPDEIVCPETQGNPMLVTILAIMSKVRLESMCWGAGTALGELPPYFMARAARLSGMDPDDDDDDLAQFEELQRKKKDELTLMERGKLFIEHIVQKVGFFGILACASIPNPLFDLAGITCGHFLVPFWTFFGATLLGKAIVKMHIQKLFVIIAFNETLIGAALAAIRQLPVIGTQLVDPFKAFLDGQKTRLHRGNETADGSASGSAGGGGGGILAAIFEKFVFAMIVYFLLSIVNSFAQSYHKRITKKRTNGKQAKD